MKYKEFASNLAEEAGKIMLDNFDSEVSRSHKNDGTFITDIDNRINDLVIKSINTAYPDHGVISEEGNDYDNEKLVWVCDPLDGTAAYAHSIPQFSFSLALVEDGQPILGVIFEPITNKLIIAEKNKGTFLNGMKATTSNTKDLSGSSITTTPSFSILREKKSKLVWMLSMASSGLLVADGMFDALVFPFKHPWDVAAAKIIIEEAGGVTSDLSGRNQRYDKKTNGFVGSNKYLHKDIINTIKGSF